MKGYIQNTFKIPAFVLGAGILFCCRELSEKETSKNDQLKHFPNEISVDLSMISTDSGRVNFQLQGKLVETFRGKINKTYIKDGLQVTFYDENKNVQAILSSYYGERDDQTGNMIVRDSVIVQNKNKDQKLFTEELIWRNDSIFTMKKVEIFTPDEYLQGIGLVADQELNYFRILYPTGNRKVK